MSQIDKIYSLEIDLKSRPKYNPMEFVQRDTLNKIFITVTNNGQAVSLEDYTYDIILQRPDSAIVKATPALQEGKLVYNVGTTEIEKVGTVVAQIEIFFGQERITTKSFSFTVVEAINNGGIIIDSETNYPVPTGTNDYNNLINKPFIPGKTSDLTNDSDFVAAAVTDALNEQIQEINAADIVKYQSIQVLSFAQERPLILNDFSGYNQPYHPSVLYIANGFNGHKYWMVQTPYPIYGTPYRDRWECPCIYCSNNGIEWVVPEGLTNPIDDLTTSEISNGDYMSDPHLVLRGETLECWYRITHKNMSESDPRYQLPTWVLRKTSTDGVTWGSRETLIDLQEPSTNGVGDMVRSPAIIWDGDKYRMWYVDKLPTVTNRNIVYAESTDGSAWENKETCTLDQYIDPWHIDVNYFDGKYHLLNYVLGAGINYYSSDDGISFTFIKELLAPSGSGFYKTGLYRSVSIKDQNNNIRVYFSSDDGSKTYLGVMSGDSFTDLDIADGQAIITNNAIKNKAGETVKADAISYAPGVTLENMINTILSRLGIVEAVTSKVVVYDTFNRANTTTSLGTADTGQAWQVLLGNWGILNNTAYTPVAYSPSLAVLESNVSNCKVSARITNWDLANQLKSPGICVRVTDTANYFRIIKNDISPSIVLQRREGGTITTLFTSNTLPLANGDKIALNMSGATIQVIYNDTVLTTITSTFNQTATKHGLCTGAGTTIATWDYFEVEA